METTALLCTAVLLLSNPTSAVLCWPMLQTLPVLFALKMLLCSWLCFMVLTILATMYRQISLGCNRESSAPQLRTPQEATKITDGPGKDPGGIPRNQSFIKRNEALPAQGARKAPEGTNEAMGRTQEIPTMATTPIVYGNGSSAAMRQSLMEKREKTQNRTIPALSRSYHGNRVTAALDAIETLAALRSATYDFVWDITYLFLDCNNNCCDMVVRFTSQKKELPDVVHHAIAGCWQLDRSAYKDVICVAMYGMDQAHIWHHKQSIQ